MNDNDRYIEVDGKRYDNWIKTEGKTYPLDSNGQPVNNEDRDALDWGSSMTCDACGTALTFPGGYSGTDLCGPCCCGESELLEERGITW
jgi:hypothetical protein